MKRFALKIFLGTSIMLLSAFKDNIPLIVSAAKIKLCNYNLEKGLKNKLTITELSDEEQKLIQDFTDSYCN